MIKLGDLILIHASDKSLREYGITQHTFDEKFRNPVKVSYIEKNNMFFRAGGFTFYTSDIKQVITKKDAPEWFI
jgi:hypothetical protein